MNFFSIRPGDYVCFNPALADHLEKVNIWLQLGDSLDEDDLYCHFVISSIYTDKDYESYLSLNCVQACGAHLIEDLSKETFNRIEEASGVTPMLFTDTMGNIQDPNFVESIKVTPLMKETERMYRLINNYELRGSRRKRKSLRLGC